ncbi:MAG: sulfatase [Planctomycetota bacterium]
MRLVVLSVAALACQFVGHACEAAETRPNILFCIADDLGWPTAGAYGDAVVRTANFDRVASEGLLFNNAYVAAPSCAPSRASILTGRMFYELEEGAIIWSSLSRKFEVFPDMLEQSGYRVGLTGKGWGPGNYKVGGFTRNPAGPTYKSFAEFLESTPGDRPFFFWYGDKDPHRPYEPGSGAASGLKAADVKLPPWFPDVPEVRGDVLDYYYEVERFDRQVGEMLELLKEKGLAENTMVVITGDNGWPFPRAKAYLFDRGVHVPLAVRWPARVPGGRVVDDFVSLADLAPTFLEAAGLRPTPQMSARSFLDVLTSNGQGQVDPRRDSVVTGLEKHGFQFPMRSIRTHQHSYIRYYAPGDYTCTDSGPTLEFLKAHADDPRYRQMAEWCFGARPAEELYDLAKDPNELKNVAGDPFYAEVKERMGKRLDAYLLGTGDPRATGQGIETLENAPRYRPPDRPTANKKTSDAPPGGQNARSKKPKQKSSENQR